MSQISPPMRIALGAALLFLAVYMVALRPKTATTTPPAPVPAGNVHTAAPAQTSLGKDVEKAQAASAASDATNAQIQAATGGSTATTPSTSTASPATTTPATTNATAAKSGGMPLPVLKAIADHKVMVLLFFNPKALDDQAVRRELRHVGSHHGKVYVKAVDVKAISRYSQITRGVDLSQTPTTVIVDPKLQATALPGFEDADTINQSVADALRVK